MLKRLTVCCLLLLSVLSGPACSAAGWDWYAGDIVRYSARNTATVIPEQVQQGIDASLDWLVLSGHAREGFFTGLRHIVQEYDLNAPRIVPILGTGWHPPGAAGDALILFGVDPRAPVPADSLQQAIAWAESHGGVSLFTYPYLPAGLPPDRWQTATAFQGIHNGVWSPECEPGAGWDRLLTSGQRIFLLGGGDGRPQQKTYVWAEHGGAAGIIEGIRRGASYVAQSDGIRMDIRVNGRPPGSTVPASRDVYVRLRAASSRPIGRVLLVADGEVVWTAHPDRAIWEERFFLPLPGRTYLRAILESADGAFRTMCNPTFLAPEADGPTGEMPLEAPDRLIPDPIYPEVDGALEVLAGLPPDPRYRILSELLQDARMRYNAVRVLEVREDLISDALLWQMADDPRREVRLGAAYALVVREPVDLPDLLQKMLADADSRVRAYAARMLSQYTAAPQGAPPAALMADPSPLVRAYLIRSLDPEIYDPDLTRYLVAAAGSPQPEIAAAAVDKLAELGTRSYRVIRAMLDSAQAGNPHVLEPVGWIGDRRAIPVLERIYLETAYGPLKRASFLALERMGAPYIGRKEAACAWMPAPPAIDGRLSPGEWASATAIREFSEDAEGAPSGREFVARVAYDSTRLYLALTCEAADTLPPVVRVRQRDDPGVRDDDRIEWAFAPSGEADTTLVFSITPLGVLHERKADDADWNADWSAALTRQEARWTVECEIPLAALGIRGGQPPAAVRFNLALVNHRPAKQRWTWSVTYNSPDNPERFGNLFFAPPPGAERPYE